MDIEMLAHVRMRANLIAEGEYDLLSRLASFADGWGVERIREVVAGSSVPVGVLPSQFGDRVVESDAGEGRVRVRCPLGAKPGGFSGVVMQLMVFRNEFGLLKSVIELVEESGTPELLPREVFVSTPSQPRGSWDLSDDVLELVRGCVDATVMRDWDWLLSLASLRDQVETVDLARVLDEYPAVLGLLPQQLGGVVEVREQDGDEWLFLACRFWEQGVGFTDLEMQLEFEALPEGGWMVTVNDLLVP